MLVVILYLCAWEQYLHWGNLLAAHFVFKRFNLESTLVIEKVEKSDTHEKIRYTVHSEPELLHKFEDWEGLVEFNQDQRAKYWSNEKTAKFKRNGENNIEEHKNIEGRERLISLCLF